MSKISRVGVITAAAWTALGAAGLSGCVDAPRQQKLNLCPTIDVASALPAEAMVGGTLTLTGSAHDSDDGPAPLSYEWTATSGTFSSSSAASPGFTCTTEGVASVTLTVSDGDSAANCAATQTITVTCTAGETVTPGIGTFDLSRYTRIARYDLPEPTRTTPPDSTSLLAQEASAVTYDWDTDTLFVVGDGGTSIVQVDKTGKLIDSMTLAPGSSPQGTEFYDTEGLSYVGNGRFVLNEERYRQVNLFTYVAGATLTRANVQTVKLGTTIGNIGLEGVTFDPSDGHYIFVKEKTPRSIFDTAIDFATGQATNGSPTTDESVDLFDPSLVPTLDFSDVFALSNLPSLAGDPSFSQLLILSQESGQIVQVDRSGNIKHSLTLRTDASDTLSIPDMTVEGITVDRDGFLYLVNEDGGGDANHPQLWVYAPSTGTNNAPTAVSITGAVTSVPENTSTAVAIKLAGIQVTDEGLGDNTLYLSGADAAAFEIVGSELFLKAGTTLNSAVQANYHVTVNVDDSTVGASPDATTAFTLMITTAVSGVANLAITEVAPWSSSYSPLAADWFEVTNFGTSAVDLTGWTMDDNSNSSALAVALSGVTSIAPGESVIFLETDTLATMAPAFVSLWFGGSAPAGLQIGSYSGSGVGLSTGGDAVNLFDNVGTLQANVSFGASVTTTLATFDNAAGLDDMMISTLSVVGQNGAFVAASDANEVGSPGTIGAGATPIVGILAIDDTASEAGSDSAVFRFTRTGSTTSSLTVSYTITTGLGQATPDDYTPALTGSVIIPAGQSSFDVTIVPVNDAVAEGTERLTLTLFDTGSYDVGSDDSATVSILDDDAANQAASAVMLINTVPALSEAAGVSSDVRLADIAITDDGLGTNNLSVSGADAAAFEVVGASLYLKAGTALSHASKPTLTVTVDVDDPSVGASPDATVDFTLTVTQAVAPGTIVISEVAPWSSASSLTADWFEVTNTGNVAIDLTGWKMDDNSHSNANAVALNGITSIAPGEAVLFLETSDLATLSASFKTLWFGTSAQPGPQIGSYAGSGVGLSGNGDEVTLFDAAGNLVAGVGFGASPTAPLATFDNHAGTGGTTPPLPVIAGLSAVGLNGAFAAAGDTNQIGSPGIGNVGRLIITEVASWGSSSSYAADWFEVTNIGSEAVDITGWTMDDSSNSVATSVAISGVTSIAPGQSVVLYEGNSSTIATNLETAWFGSSVPSGFLIGSYSGSGVGLSSSGDGVNLFNASGHRVTGVTFGAATNNFTFDNAAGNAALTTLSVAGVHGAFLAADGVETGSPGLSH